MASKQQSKRTCSKPRKVRSALWYCGANLTMPLVCPSPSSLVLPEIAHPTNRSKSWRIFLPFIVLCLALASRLLHPLIPKPHSNNAKDRMEVYEAGARQGQHQHAQAVQRLVEAGPPGAQGTWQRFQHEVGRYHRPSQDVQQRQGHPQQGGQGRRRAVHDERSGR